MERFGSESRVSVSSNQTLRLGLPNHESGTTKTRVSPLGNVAYNKCAGVQHEGYLFILSSYVSFGALIELRSSRAFSGIRNRMLVLVHLLSRGALASRAFSGIRNMQHNFPFAFAALCGTSYSTEY